ncbi:hypothetical protein F4778DRAFT_782530 [Xylariomycetidae sp. FL2044]|nr:hypothetical protein F4778DRAFT_782530 [Xylariomycetidae sp. FL2044]
MATTSPGFRCPDYPPSDYVRPEFPSLCWPPQKRSCAIYTVYDSWRYTLLWTVIIYGLFHLGSVGIALLMQVGRRRSVWKYLWAVPASYVIVAGVESLLAGSIVGLVYG